LVAAVTLPCSCQDASTTMGRSSADMPIRAMLTPSTPKAYETPNAGIQACSSTSW
jgi:hypothetical protein